MVGKLIYDLVPVEFYDRLLSHLQIVIMNKLRRHEGFAMSWRDDPAIGNGRSCIWLDASIPIYFTLDKRRSPTIDQKWLAKLAESAPSSSGLVITDENGERINAQHFDRRS